MLVKEATGICENSKWYDYSTPISYGLEIYKLYDRGPDPPTRLFQFTSNKQLIIETHAPTQYQGGVSKTRMSS